MRDKKFIAQHRGGLLTKQNHQLLIRWARGCAEHVLPLIGMDVDKRLVNALRIAEEWENDNVSTGDAMKASVAAHAVAREASDPVTTAVARSIGHAVATAHMADHSTGAALYALKALKLTNLPFDKEREWQYKQLQQLPSDIVTLIQNTLAAKEKLLLKK